MGVPMSDAVHSAGYTDGDVDTNQSDNPHLSSLIEARYSRRQTLRGGVAALTLATFSSALLAACDDDNDGESDQSVDAGQNGQSRAGKVVRLNGTASAGLQPVGWTQTSGPAVTLLDAGTNQVRDSVSIAGARDVVVTPDGKQVYVSSERNVVVIDPNALAGTG